MKQVYYSHPCATMTDVVLEGYVAALEHWFGFKLDLTQGPRMMSFAHAKELRQRGHICFRSTQWLNRTKLAIEYAKNKQN